MSRKTEDSIDQQPSGTKSTMGDGVPVRTARIHLLSAAVERLGPMEVAKRLNVPAVILQDWIDHKVAVPPAKVLELIDLLDSIGAF